jgi:hypothetical protein
MSCGSNSVDLAAKLVNTTKVAVSIRSGGLRRFCGRHVTLRPRCDRPQGRRASERRGAPNARLWRCERCRRREGIPRRQLAPRTAAAAGRFGEPIGGECSPCRFTFMLCLLEVPEQRASTGTGRLYAALFGPGNESFLRQLGARWQQRVSPCQCLLRCFCLLVKRRLMRRGRLRSVYSARNPVSASARR